MQRLSSWPLLWLFSSLRWTSTRDRLTDLAAEEGRVRAQIKKRDDAERRTGRRGEPGPDPAFGLSTVPAASKRARIMR
jgi:hypothetical protein